MSIRPVVIGDHGRNLLAEFAAGRSSTERQSHGFVFQDFLIERLNLVGDDAYTAKWDAKDRDGVLYSLKNTRDTGAIDLGDLARQAAINVPYRMLNGRWTGHGLHVATIVPLWFEPSVWRSFFPADITPFLAENAFDGISNDSSDDRRWRLRRKELRSLWDSQVPPDNPIRPRFKRDSKRQLRVQAAITRKGFNQLAVDHFDTEMVPLLREAFDVG